MKMVCFCEKVHFRFYRHPIHGISLSSHSSTRQQKLCTKTHDKPHFSLPLSPKRYPQPQNPLPL